MRSMTDNLEIGRGGDGDTAETADEQGRNQSGRIRVHKRMTVVSRAARTAQGINGTQPNTERSRNSHTVCD